MIQTIGKVFTQMITWLGQFVTALLTEGGALQPLLEVFCIGIAVSLTLVGVKIVSRLTWGR